MVAQGLLDFQYEGDSSSHGLTSLGGLPVYLDLIKASGLGAAIRRHVGAAGEQGWLDIQMVLAVIFLNLSGGRLRRRHRKAGARPRLGGDPARDRAGVAVARRTALAQNPLAARALPRDALAVGAVGLAGAVPR
jgi:hypothetical protein